MGLVIEGVERFCSDACIVICSTHGSAAVEWQWAPWAKSLMQSGVLRPQLALFSVSGVGNHLLHQIPDKRILGSIVIPEISLVRVKFTLKSLCICLSFRVGIID